MEPGTRKKSKLEALVLIALLAIAGVLAVAGGTATLERQAQIKQTDPHLQLERGTNCKGKGKRALGRVCLA